MHVKAAPRAAGRVAPPMAKPLLFLHIPKTAGTSFIGILRNLFGDAHVLRLTAGAHLPARIDALAGGGLAGLSCIASHAPASAWLAHLARVRPFTLLRDPVARVLSLYRFLRRASAADLVEHGLAPGFGFDDFITSRAPATYAQTHNGMCRMLCLDPAMQDPNTAAFWDQDAMVPALDAAFGFLQRIEFGLVEAMADSLAQFGKAWGVPFPLETGHENATDPDPTLGIDALRRVAALNSADIALYQAAAAVFRQRNVMQQTGTTAGSVWMPALGTVCPIADIPARQGFHDFEAGAGFAWLSAEAPARLHFQLPPAAANRPIRMVLRVYAIHSGYDAAGTMLSVNGQRVGVTRSDADGAWCTLTSALFTCGPGPQTLTIEPPYAVPVRFIEPASQDRRSLSFALSAVMFTT